MDTRDRLSGVVAAAGSELTGPLVFRAAAAVRDRVSGDVAGCRHPVSPVSAGFLSVHTELSPDFPGVAVDALRLGRPVAFVGDAAADTGSIAHATGSRWIGPSRADGPPVAFAVPEAFVRDRLAAVRRRHGRRPLSGDVAHQRVTAIGVGPRPRAELRTLLARVQAVVATDWTYAHTVPQLPAWTRAARHSVRYDIIDYDSTIRGVDVVLGRLQETGVLDVAVLVEGNPDTLDVLDGVCPHRRSVHVVPGVPIGVTAAGDLTRLLPPGQFAAGLAYLSGLPGRHEQSRTQLLHELTRYLAAGVPCILVEMTFGDLGTALQAVCRTAAPKTLVLLTDCYSPGARVMVANATSARETRRMLACGRGRLSTLMILDEVPGLDAGDVLRLVR